MKLSDMAMLEPEEDMEGEEAEAGEGLFEDAAVEAFELFKQGKKSEAAAALKGAIESCVADYMAEE